MAILKKIKFGASTNNIAKTVVQGKPEGVISVTNTSGFNNTDSEEKDYSYDIDVNVDGTTLVKSTTTGDNPVTQLAVGTVPAASVSVADSGDKFTATDVEAALAELKDDIDSTGGAAKTYKIVEVASPASTSLKEYKVQVAVGSGSFADDTNSATIVVPKDQHLKSVSLEDEDDKHTAGQFLKFTYVLNDGTESVVYVDVSAFLAQSEFGDGLEVSNAGVVSAKLGQGLEFGGESGEKQSIKVKIDTTSENFLTVGANGVKISGVQDAIDTAIQALDVTTDTAVAGQYVAAIQEADGLVSVKTRANVSDAVLTGYAKGSAPAAGSEAVAATDDVKGAIAKLEHQVDAAKSAASAAHSVVAKDSGNTHVTVTVSQPDASTGAITYTIGESDIASAQGLAGEITRAQTAEGEIAGLVGLGGTEGARTFTPTTNYGGNSASVAANMQALDTQVHSNAADIEQLQDAVNAITYEVNGTELIFRGIEPYVAPSPEPEPEP